MIKNSNLIAISLLFVPHIITIIGQLIFAKFLSTEEFGTFALFSIVTGAVLVLTNWSSDKYFIANRDILSSEMSQIITYELLFCLSLFSITVLFFRGQIETYIGIHDSILLWGLLCVTFFYFPLTRSKSILEKKIKFIPAYLPNFIANFISISLGIFCLYQNWGFWSLIIWRISIYIFEIIIIFFILPTVPSLKLTLLPLNNFLKYTTPLYFGGIISFLGSNIDKFIISLLLSTKELGLYWLAFSLSHIPVILRDIVTRISLPIMSRENLYSTRIKVFDKINLVLQIGSAFFAIFACYWSDIVIEFVLGAKWGATAPIFIILFYAALLKLVGGACASLLFAEMQTKITLNISWINLLILSPITMIFAYLYGLIGAAISILITTLIINLYVYETKIKDISSNGSLYYLGFFLVNIILLLAFDFMFEVQNMTILQKFIGTLINLFICLFLIIFLQVSDRFYYEK